MARPDPTILAEFRAANRPRLLATALMLVAMASAATDKPQGEARK